MFPKFIPGQVILIDGACYTIDACLDSPDCEGWDYEVLANTSVPIQLCESAITHVLNNGFWVPVERWNSPQEAVMTQEMLSGEKIWEEMTKTDPEEEEWLKKHQQKRIKINVKD